MNTSISSNNRTAAERDYSVFEADISGAALNLTLLRRLLGWLRPYKGLIAISSILVLVASALQILLPIIISLVVIDHILRGNSSNNSPDFGLVELNVTLSEFFGLPPLIIACGMYIVFQLGSASIGHAHRMTLVQAVINGLRDLRLDLFSHMETRPSSFFDRVAVGRVMTRVTNDVEALYELLRGLGTLVGEFVPFFVALFVMSMINVELTLLLLLALPLIALVTFLFRRKTRVLFRQARQTLSSMNQNLQENLAGLQVVQISDRQQHNLGRYTRINKENRGYEVRLG